MKFQRASGILLHLTSLAGEFGIGDLGPSAYRFVDLLSQTGQTYWQMLPVGPTGYGDSPYSSFSVFAGNPLLISPEKLVQDGFLDEIGEVPEFEHGRTDYGAVYHWKKDLLARAYAKFAAGAGEDVRASFDQFCDQHSSWLTDYALYRAIRDAQGQRPWFEWDTPLKLREPGAIAAISEILAGPTRAEKFTQYLFFRQWTELKEYAAAAGIKFVADAPIFAAHDSADVWCNRDKFKLKADGSPKVVAGVPPDSFSSTGQLWGSPIYNWDAMRDDGFAWWTARVKHALSMADVLRIDHFVGLAHAWEVPGGDKTAENGEWVDVPGLELFSAFKDQLGELPLWAEDLGEVTAQVEELRDNFEIPGMRILQYAFGGDPASRDLPHNYIQNCVAYTGTHDNDTARGWFEALPEADDESGNRPSFCLKYINGDADTIHWDMIRAISSSVADTAIVPMQDLLGLGSEARMNVPAGAGPNWQWRMLPDAVTEEITTALKELTAIYGRSKKL
ncbi:MAG: 4-alpha-glucanotransferase [Acidobacteriota bacterium]